MSQSGYVHLDVDKIKRVTDSTLLAEIGGDDVWLPLSQIADAEQYEEGDENVTVSVTEWIANQKGLGD